MIQSFLQTLSIFFFGKPTGGIQTTEKHQGFILFVALRLHGFKQMH